jgi:hypothetical protein
MEIPSLVRDGLCREFEHGYDSSATNLLYEHKKKSSEEISKMIRDTWVYIKDGNASTHIISHFLYLLHCEIDREWIQDISTDIIQFGLKSTDIEVMDETLQLLEDWHDEDLLELLNQTEIKTEWLNDYKLSILKDYKYLK